MQNSTKTVRIVEVGPRDGLQNIPQSIDSAIKLELIRRLRDAGLQTIELTSFVSPRAIPQLADAQVVVQNADIQTLLKNPKLRLPVLVPNLKGLERALQNGIKEVAVFISATEGFSRANINCTIEEGLERARQVASRAASAGVSVRGYVSCIFADPYDGPTQPSSVLQCTKALIDAGCYEVSLGDTLGIGTPAEVRWLITYLQDNGVPLEMLAGHFHDTYGGAVANVWEAYKCGLRVFDSSVAGLGGCPFAPGAKGNVASEDLVYMFEQSGIRTGVDQSKLVETGEWISRQLSTANSSRAGAALWAKRKQTAISKSPKEVLVSWKLVQQTEGLQLFRSGVNLRVNLNRPKNGNALTVTMIQDLTDAVTNAGRDATVSRIILTGNGKFFCTGMDLGKGSTAVGQGGSSSNAQFDRLTNLFEAIDQSPKVTIACLNGPAFGGGAGLAFACDMRFAVRTASVTLSEVKLGLCPATISKYVIREFGIALAREAMLSARPVSAGELKARGLVVELADSAKSLPLLLDQSITKLKAASPEASRMSKELIRLAWAHGGKEEQAKGIRALFDSMMRPDGDGAYGVKEFQAKRLVDWDAYTLRRVDTAKL
ncbi:uncharacterized protein BDW70DRAFT_153925 [Aspergillus foveolatus]|uniref:uncharacterized protein n=1 Tax=Aspergillus foveolatus TaxID=210207 RepID=UPI003CCD176F